MDLQRGAEERGCGFRVKKTRIHVHLQAGRHISSVGIVSFSLHPVAFIFSSLLTQHIRSLVYKKSGILLQKVLDCDGATLKPRGVPPPPNDNLRYKYENKYRQQGYLEPRSDDPPGDSNPLINKHARSLASQQSQQVQSNPGYITEQVKLTHET